jgi:hypothetical protein
MSDVSQVTSRMHAPRACKYRVRMPLTVDEVSQVVGVALSEPEAQALADWYATQAQLVAAFPQADLKRVEPPLRSLPGPTA